MFGSDLTATRRALRTNLEHTPVERQCTRFARLGVEVAPQTLGRSVAAHIDLLALIARLIEDKTRGPGLLGTDATGMPILDPDTVDGIRTGAMWAWTNARWVSFFYSPKNWLFTWLDVGGERTAAILSIIATCIAHDVNPRAYLHVVTRLVVHGWPQRRLRELLPDRILALHPELAAGDFAASPAARRSSE